MRSAKSLADPSELLLTNTMHVVQATLGSGAILEQQFFPVVPFSKSNSRRRRIVKRGGHTPVPVMALSSEAERARDAFVAHFIAQGWHRLFDTHDVIGLICEVRFSSFRPDLDCELIPDAMQAAGVVANDRCIDFKLCVRLPPGEPSGTAITVFKLGERKTAARKRGVQ